MKRIRDTTVSEGIDEVLELAKEPLTSYEIFQALPSDRLVKLLSFREFWQHFGMMRKRKRDPVLKVKCIGKDTCTWCYCLHSKGWHDKEIN